MSWAVRTLSVMVAGGYMVDPAKGNPMLEQARELAIDDFEAAQLEDAKTVGQKRKLSEPAIGSYERFMSAFGGKLK